MRLCSKVFISAILRSEKPNTLSLHMFSLKTKGRASAYDHNRLEQQQIVKGKNA